MVVLQLNIAQHIKYKGRLQAKRNEDHLHIHFHMDMSWSLTAVNELSKGLHTAISLFLFQWLCNENNSALGFIKFG